MPTGKTCLHYRDPVLIEHNVSTLYMCLHTQAERLRNHFNTEFAKLFTKYSAFICMSRLVYIIG